MKNGFASLLLLFLTSCFSCGDKPDSLQLEPTATWNCEEQGRPTPAQACPEGSVFIDGECRAQTERCDMSGASDCCPGSICTAIGQCQNVKLTECLDDSECSGTQHCVELPNLPQQKVCAFKPLAENSTCAPGENPFNGRCIQAIPCQGSCAQGTVCNIDTNRCEKPPFLEATAKGCAQSCSPGTMLVYNSPDTMVFNGCCAVECECATLPAINPGLWGQYSDTVFMGNTFYASAYNKTYGDLVLASYDTTTLTHLEFVDGVPSTGSLGGDSSGIRHGIVDAGLDVGKYSSLAAFNNTLHIAYYDSSADAIKYAHSENGSWVISVIDDGRSKENNSAKATVGKYTSITLDANGIAHVAYLAHRILQNGHVVTTPYYARAKYASPQGYDDWEHVVVEPLLSCNNACDEKNGEVCVLDNGEAKCMLTTSHCAAACACDSACVSTAQNGVCKPLLPNFISGDTCEDCPNIEDLPDANGLFTSIALFNNVPILTYYNKSRVQFNKSRGQLRGAIANMTSDNRVTSFATQPLACSTDLEETIGMHAAMTLSPDNTKIAVAFQGINEDGLYVYESENFITGEIELVDDGARSDSNRNDRLNKVGSYASPAYDAQNKLYIAYADDTFNDLLWAYRNANGWTHETIVSEGMCGAFAKLAIQKNQAYISHYRRNVETTNGDKFEVFIKTLP